MKYRIEQYRGRYFCQVQIPEETKKNWLWGKKVIPARWNYLDSSGGVCRVGFATGISYIEGTNPICFKTKEEAETFIKRVSQPTQYYEIHTKII
jgi:hypothetical protein